MRSLPLWALPLWVWFATRWLALTLPQWEPERLTTWTPPVPLVLPWVQPPDAVEMLMPTAAPLVELPVVLPLDALSNTANAPVLMLAARAAAPRPATTALRILMCVSPRLRGHPQAPDGLIGQEKLPTPTSRVNKSSPL